MSERAADRARYDRATAHLDAPLAIVDLEAFDANATDPLRRAGGRRPLLGAAADDLLIGDRVWFRHAKAGELCEHLDQLHLVEGDRVVGSVPTYRGEGRTFL